MDILIDFGLLSLLLLGLFYWRRADDDEGLGGDE